MQANNKAYYVNFDTQMLLGAKELLKSMPTFYNKIYFSTKYASALWSGDKNENFTNVTILTENENIETLRQIIKNNFLYIGDWDSRKFTDKADYGFSFIGGNIKYILMPFIETQTGYVIRSYDVDKGDCYETTVDVDKKYFLDVSMKENGEIVRICDFNLEYINEGNTKIERAPKKAGPELVMYDSRGHIAINTIVIMLITVLGFTAVYATYNLVVRGIIG
ncbi:MAG TPA: hypothetical protein DCY94_04975 [Firmicutes bacterium]|nr:hypothetical protein [Bacillota bacterium]